MVVVETSTLLFLPFVFAAALNGDEMQIKSLSLNGWVNFLFSSILCVRLV